MTLRLNDSLAYDTPSYRYAIDNPQGGATLYIEDEACILWSHTDPTSNGRDLLQKAIELWNDDDAAWELCDESLPIYTDGIHQVWGDRASPDAPTVFICGEMDVTTEALEVLDIDVLISMNHISEKLQDRVAAHAKKKPNFIHCVSPIYDDEPAAQLDTHAERVKTALVIFSMAAQEGKRIALHCSAGIHRSPSLVFAGLAIAGLVKSPIEAYIQIRKRRYVGWFPEMVQWMVDSYHKGYLDDGP